jgi:D-arabinose 1-dehydrogenase-like Zn-dependent alcohol dehydrogenase
MIEELIKNACSNGEDIDIQLYFAGRHRELYQALDAVDKHGMVAIGGYSSSGKTYLALKLLDRLGVSVKTSLIRSRKS